PEAVLAIQCHALAALGETRNPEAITKLVLVAREPKPPFGAELNVKQQSADLRLAAIRALGNFNRSEASEALVLVLRSEKDVALHNSARESLESATGKKVADDPGSWDNLIAQQKIVEAGGTVPSEGNKFNLLSYFQK